MARRNQRRLALIAGVLFVITFIAAIAARILFDPVRDDTDYIVGAGADSRVFLGATMELLLIIANIGTAVVLFPILKGFKSSSPILDQTRPTGFAA
jgi:hypothetical protein